MASQYGVIKRRVWRGGCKPAAKAKLRFYIGQNAEQQLRWVTEAVVIVLSEFVSGGMQNDWRFRSISPVLLASVPQQELIEILPGLFWIYPRHYHFFYISYTHCSLSCYIYISPPFLLSPLSTLCLSALLCSRNG
jgi:hypothetical protein